MNPSFPKTLISISASPPRSAQVTCSPEWSRVYII
jgi:hypothetical protein